jgi:hypothetical protein
MENEGTCIKALQGVYWWGLEDGNEGREKEVEELFAGLSI